MVRNSSLNREIGTRRPAQAIAVRPHPSRQRTVNGILLTVVLVMLTGISVVATSRPAEAATLPPGFQESVVISGLTQPTAVRFSPDGRVFVAE